jgi:PAS domain S-box-containing protein
MDDRRLPTLHGPTWTIDVGVTQGEASDYAVLLLDTHGTVVSWTADAQALYQYTAKEVVGLGFWSLGPVGRSGAAKGVLDASPDRALDGPVLPRPVKGWCRRRDQTRFWAEVTAVPLRRATGLLVGFGIIVHDLTPHGLTDEYAAILDSVPDAVIGVNSAGRIVFANYAVETIFGYRRPELVGSDVQILVPVDVQVQLRSLLDRGDGRFGMTRVSAATECPERRPSGLRFNLTGLRKSGVSFPAEVSLASVVTTQGLVTTAVVRDVETDPLRR